MKTCKITLFTGRTVSVSREAADLAIAVDRIQRHPQLARQLAPAIEAVTRSAALIDAVEKMAGRSRLNELVNENFPATNV